MADWEPAEDLAARLKAVREGMGLTQQEFGDLLGVTDQTVSDWEGGRTVPRRSRLVQIAKRAGILVHAFAAGAPMPVVSPSRPQEPRSRPEPPPGPPEDADRLKGLLARLDFLHTQIRAYRDLNTAPSPEILAEWLRVTADMDDGD